MIILRGIGKAVADAHFDLRPLMPEQDGPAQSLPGLTEVQPFDVRATEDGLALYLGPDIALHPLFVPGSAVEITLPGAGIGGEFLWPAITPVARPKRRNIMTRRAMPDPLVRPPLPAQPEAVNAEPGESDRGARGEPAAPVLASAVPASDELPAPAARRTMVLTSSRSRRVTATEAFAPAGTEGIAIEAAPSEVAPPAKSVAAVEVRPPSAEPSIHVAAARAERRDPPPVQAQVASKPVDPAPVRASESPAAAVIAGQASRPAAEQQPSRPVPEAAPAAQRAASRRGLSTVAAVWLALVAFAAAQAIALRTFNLSIVTRRDVAAAPVKELPAPTVAIPGRATAPGQPRPASSSSPADTSIAEFPTIYDLIAVGSRSPRGGTAENVTAARALQLAHGFLHGGDAERDPEEAAFWLKRYLSGASGGENIRIALTQLGSAYAYPRQGKRGFARARVVWEIAGALGDPVAMCFLGAVHEHGLGLQAAPALAVVWYERAEVAGRRCAQGQRGTGLPGAE